MLKLRNVIIIFILAWMLIDLGDFITERVTISNAARTTNVYSRIAAECALKSATMSDDFFTAGVTDNQTYNDSVKEIQSGLTGDVEINYVSDAKGFRLVDYDDSTKFEIVANPYVALYNDAATLERSKVEFADSCFDRMYASSDTWANWVKNIFTVYNYGLGAVRDDEIPDLFPRRVIWTDTLLYPYDMTGIPSFMTIPISGTIQLPRLVTMGGALFTNSMINDGIATGSATSDMTEYSSLFSMFDTTQTKNIDAATIRQSAYDLGISNPEGIINRLNGYTYADIKYSSLDTSMLLSGVYAYNEGESPQVIYDERYRSLLESADYWDAKRTTSINRGSTGADGSWNASVEGGIGYKDGNLGNLYFYYTPTSLGLTYLDPDLLNMLYRSNMDLLMRAKYITDDGKTLEGYHTYVYTDDSGYYNDFEANNKDADDTFSDVYVNNGIFYYKRGKLGYDSSSAGDTLRYYDINGAELSNPKIEYVYINVCDALNGSLDVQNDPSINAMLQRAISPNVSLSSLAQSSLTSEGQSYEIVLAKVTFESDFIFPYKTKTMRGMAEHFETGDASNLHALVIGESEGSAGRNALIDTQAGTFDYKLGSDGNIHCYYTTYYCVSLGGYES